MIPAQCPSVRGSVHCYRSVFVEPRTAPERNIRSIEYDTVSDKFGHYLLEEVFPEVEKHIPLPHDAYSRALAGESSGGICAFNAAYLMPDQFSRVLSWIGSFAALQTNDAHPPAARLIRSS